VATTLAGVETPIEDPGRYAVTQGLIARSPVLARRVLDAAGFPGAPTRTLTQHSDVEPDADVLQFFIENSDPAVATRLANTYAREYTVFRRELDNRDLAATAQSLGSRLRVLAQEGRGSSQLYRQLAAQQEQVQLLKTLRRSNVYVIRTATPGDAEQLSPRPLHSTALAVGGALVLGLLLVGCANAFDRRVFDVREISEAVGAPLLGRVPPASGRTALEGDDALRLASMLDRAARAAEARSLLLAGAGPGGQRGLASAVVGGLARLGVRVLVVDADLRTRGLTSAFRLEGRPGLVDRIRGDAEGGEETVRAGDAGGGLRVLPAGSHTGDPASLLVSPAATNVLRDLSGGADLVVVAGPPFAAAPESVTLAAAVDSVILTIQLGVDRRTLGELRRALDVTPAGALGFVLVERRSGGSLVRRLRRRPLSGARGAGPTAPAAAELGARTTPEEVSC
ncbi:MAG: hypothetical protein ACRDM1_13935, partial [Gaiellaceae bacterium]